MWPFTRTVPQAEIIAAFDPWVLACAVGSKNGKGFGRIGFNEWRRLSEPTWLPEVRAKLPRVARNAIVSALLSYVADNEHKNYKVVLAEECKKRGEKPWVVLSPGESMNVTMTVGPIP